MRVGYVRVFTVEQSEKRQIVELKENANVEKFFVDKVSSKSAKRPKFDEMMNFLREGIAIAKAAGKYKGRNSKKRSKDFDFYKQGYFSRQYTVTEIAKHYKVSRPTVYKWLRQ